MIDGPVYYLALGPSVSHSCRQIFISKGMVVEEPGKGFGACHRISMVEEVGPPLHIQRDYLGHSKKYVRNPGKWRAYGQKPDIPMVVDLVLKIMVGQYGAHAVSYQQHLRIFGRDAVHNLDQRPYEFFPPLKTARQWSEPSYQIDRPAAQARYFA